MSWTGTLWIGVGSRTTYVGCGNGSTRRRRPGPQPGPQPAEADAAFPRERSVERATGNGDQRWPQDGRGRPTRRGRGRGQGRHGHLASARHDRLATPTRQAGVHSQGERETARTRDTGDRRQGASGPDVNALEPEWEARFESRSY